MLQEQKLVQMTKLEKIIHIQFTGKLCPICSRSINIYLLFRWKRKKKYGWHWHMHMHHAYASCMDVVGALESESAKLDGLFFFE